MSSFSTGPQTAAPAGWPFLGINERRVLGVLVEKAKTTPDAYPLSLNALTVGSNQKSNRDPVLDLNDLDVEEALAGCQKNGLAFKITGSRVDRWKHNLYEAWKVNKVELAVIGELLLRGAQTEGELRSRASRMEPIADLDALRAIVQSLAARGLVVYLSPEGRRGTTVTHGLHSPKELERLRATQPADNDGAPPAFSPAPRPDAPAPGGPQPHAGVVLESQVAALQTDMAGLRGEVAELRAALTTVSNQLRSLKEALGA